MRTLAGGFFIKRDTKGNELYVDCNDKPIDPEVAKKHLESVKAQAAENYHRQNQEHLARVQAVPVHVLPGAMEFRSPEDVSEARANVVTGFSPEKAELSADDGAESEDSEEEGSEEEEEAASEEIPELPPDSRKRKR